MTNSTDTQQQYGHLTLLGKPQKACPHEGAILSQLIKNSERLAVVENDIAQIKKSQETAKWLLVTIAIGVLINIISQPILSFLN